MLDRATLLLVCGAAAALSASGAHAKEASDLHTAASQGDVVSVRRLLVSRSDVAAKDSRGHTALARASEHGHSAVVRALLQSSSGKEMSGRDIQKALDVARGRRFESIRSLLEAELETRGRRKRQEEARDTRKAKSKREADVKKQEVRGTGNAKNKQEAAAGRRQPSSARQGQQKERQKQAPHSSAGCKSASCARGGRDCAEGDERCLAVRDAGKPSAETARDTSASAASVSKEPQDAAKIRKSPNTHAPAAASGRFDRTQHYNEVSAAVRELAQKASPSRAQGSAPAEAAPQMLQPPQAPHSASSSSSASEGVGVAERADEDGASWESFGATLFACSAVTATTLFRSVTRQLSVAQEWAWATLATALLGVGYNQLNYILRRYGLALPMSYKEFKIRYVDHTPVWARWLLMLGGTALGTAGVVHYILAEWRMWQLRVREPLEWLRRARHFASVQDLIQDELVFRSALDRAKVKEAEQIRYLRMRQRALEARG